MAETTTTATAAATTATAVATAVAPTAATTCLRADRVLGEDAEQQPDGLPLRGEHVNGEQQQRVRALGREVAHCFTAHCPL